MKRHVIFDFDDTISSGYEHNQQLFVDTFLPHKPDIDQEYVRMVHYSSRGRSMDEQFKNVIDKFHLKVSVEQLAAENEELHKQNASEMKMFPGLEDLFKHFKSMGMIVSLCTNRAKGSLELILTKNKMLHHFDNVISCRDEGYEKPDPYCLNMLLDKYPDIDKSEAIFFGDSKTDADFANNAGIDFLVIDHYLNKKSFYLMALNLFAGNEDELLAEVDKNNKEIGAIFRADAHRDPSRYHRSASILVFNSKGQIVLNKRSKFKLVDQGKWDLTGGHQAFGMTIKQAAETELYEELGIQAKLHAIRVGLRQDEKQSEYYHLFYTVHDGPYTSQPQEVEEIKAFDCQKLLDGKYDKTHEFLYYVKERVKETKSVWEKLANGSHK